MFLDSSSDLLSYDFPMPTKPQAVAASSSSITRVVRKRRARSASRPRSAHRYPTDVTFLNAPSSASTSSTSELHMVRADPEIEPRRHSADYRPSFSPTLPRWERGINIDNDDQSLPSLYPEFRKAPTYRSGVSGHRDIASLFLTDDDQYDEGLSPFGDSAEPSPRRRSFTISIVPPPTPKDEIASMPSPISDDLDHAPSCVQSLRREWQSISLRLSFGIFRTKRRIMRRLRPTGTG